MSIFSEIRIKKEERKNKNIATGAENQRPDRRQTVKYLMDFETA